MKRTELMMLVLGLFIFTQAAQADWTPARRLTWNAGNSEHPAIAVDSTGGLHVVWQDATPGKGQYLYYKRSTDGGVTWTANKKLTWDSRVPSLPNIAVDPSGSLHLFWHTNDAAYSDIYYKKSTDGGNSWTGNKRLTWTQDNESPEIAVDSSGNLHLAWYSPLGLNLDTFYRKSTDGGSTWTPSKRITFTFGQDSAFPVIIADLSGNIHVVWEEHVWVDDTRIHYKKSSDNGATWSTSKKLSWIAGESRHPRMAIDSSGHLHVVYFNAPSIYEGLQYEVYYRESTDAGDTWTAGKRLTWNSVPDEHPAIAVDSTDNLHLVWEEDAPWASDIFCKSSTDGGDTWSSSQNLANTSLDSLHPRMASETSGNIHLVWYDYTPGNCEIYYMKYVE